MRQIKLAVRQLLGARKYSVSHRILNFITLGQTMYEKSVTILHPSLFWRHRGTSWAKCTTLGPDVQQGPSVSLPNFVDFVDGMTDKKVNDMTPHIPCGDNNCLDRTNRHNTQL